MAIENRKNPKRIREDKPAGSLSEKAMLQTAAACVGSIVEPVGRSLVSVSSAISLVMASLIVIDIVLRRFLNAPISGLIEIETFLLTVLFFLSLPFTTSRDGHVSVDLLKNKFSLKLNVFLGAVFSLFAICFFGIVSWQNVVRAIEAFHAGESSDVRAWPLYPFLLLSSFGFALMTLVLIKGFLEYMGEITRAFRKTGTAIFLVFLIAAAVLFTAPMLRMLSVPLGPSAVGVLFLLFMLVLMLMGFPVAFTMGLIGFMGTWYLIDGDIALGVIRMSVYESVSNYFFCVLPFFILMGFLCLKAGVTEYLFRAGHNWFGRLPGGLAIGTITGCAGFAAICGDSMATAATMGSVSLPEMKRYSYADSLATGAVAAGGTLGILIPPSLGMIIYAIITEESVGKLFMAGILPGVLLTLMFSVSVYIRCKFDPALGPKGPSTTFAEKLSSLRNVWPVFVLFAVVIGGIYLGYFTPTEAGGVGVIGALIVAVTSRDFSWGGFVEALFTSMRMTAMIFTILIGVTILGYFVTLTEIPLKLADVITNLDVSRYVIFVLILLLYLILGMMMNIVPMMMLTLPILFPTVVALGFDPIWFGVIMVIMMEMGQITPPVGINVFVISGVAGDVPMGTIFKGIFPFVLVEILVIVILTLLPQIAMVLPDAMEVLPSIGS